jgi:hypothetical protein
VNNDSPKYLVDILPQNHLEMLAKNLEQKFMSTLKSPFKTKPSSHSDAGVFGGHFEK